MIVMMVMTLAKMMMTVKTPPHCGNTETFEEFRTKVAAIILMTKLSISMIWMCGVNPFFIFLSNGQWSDLNYLENRTFVLRLEVCV